MLFPFIRARRQLRDVTEFLFPNAAPSCDTIERAAVAITTKVTGRPAVETFQLGSFVIPRLLNGLWQLSSPSWGSGTAESQETALLHAVESGLTAADMADHYVGDLKRGSRWTVSNLSLRVMQSFSLANSGVSLHLKSRVLCTPPPSGYVYSSLSP